MMMGAPSAALGKAERDAWIQAKIAKNRKLKENEEARLAEEALQAKERLWSPYGRAALVHNELNIAWKGDLDIFHWTRVLPYRDLVALRVTGHALVDVPAELPIRLPSLQILCLISNQLETLPDNLGLLTHLVELDLTKNKLKALPESICNIKTLTYLNLSNNVLETLPSRFGELFRLERVWVEGNQLTQTPLSFGKLRCSCANLNGNRLRDWNLWRPEFTLLTTLTLNLNHLTGLPDTLCTLPALTSLSASNNNLTCLPESFGSLVKLRWLRLDWNRIKELPYSFRHLTALESIHMERNPMTMPPLEIIYQGASTAVAYMHQRYLAWLRQERRKVVEQLQAVLAAFQVELDVAMSGRPTSDVESWAAFLAVFTPGVERIVRGTALPFYALVLPALFSGILPTVQRHWADHPELRPSDSIVSFDFFDLPERVVVDAMTNYDDEYSMALVTDQAAYFRRCGCIDPTTNARKPCNRTPTPYQCERHDAALFRVKMVTAQEYKEMQSDSYLVARRERLANAMRAKCVEYINSEPGIEFFDKTSIECAKTLLAARVARDKQVKQNAKHAKAVASTRRKTLQKIQALQAKHSRRSLALGKTMEGLRKELDLVQLQIRAAAPGQGKALLARRDELDKRIDQAKHDLRLVEQDPALRKLQQKIEALDGNPRTSTKSSQHSTTTLHDETNDDNASHDEDDNSKNSDDRASDDEDDAESASDRSDSDETSEELADDPADANSWMAGLGDIPGLEPVTNWIDAATAIIEGILDTRQPPKKPHLEEVAHMYNHHLRDTYTKHKMAKVRNKVTTEFYQMRFVLRKWYVGGRRCRWP
ncbi:hypothetical protein, variant [Aphanomyces invadans]|uniref:Uncharacterized protein n=1 Tax=Aphanomyces invadans TaxID=157072 RepID=A0A024UTZ6_9STRA|nr:hypothetical protein, variant [Aphanomyces invadans]ETW09143.1 hypothetical protein, variant [Aphanomyces invadans]|eukprot:XP_008862948.1 hypothetical protein, variant [Aphanomyces invadans]